MPSCVLEQINFRRKWPNTFSIRGNKCVVNPLKGNSVFHSSSYFIVVAIILVIASIAIPSLLNAMMSGRESATVGNLRALTSANATYQTAWSNGFAPTLAALAPPSGGGNGTCDTAGLIDAVLASGTKSQYTYTYSAGSAVASKPSNCGTAGVTSFEISAVPMTVGKSGRKSFCLDSNGTIHQDPNGGGIADDAACQALAAIGQN